MWWNPFWWFLLVFELVDFFDSSIYEANLTKRRKRQ